MWRLPYPVVLLLSCVVLCFAVYIIVYCGINCCTQVYSLHSGNICEALVTKASGG